MAEYFQGFIPGWSHSANPSWANLAENDSIPPQWHHTTCGHWEERLKSNDGRKKKYHLHQVFQNADPNDIQKANTSWSGRLFSSVTYRAEAHRFFASQLLDPVFSLSPSAPDAWSISPSMNERQKPLSLAPKSQLRQPGWPWWCWCENDMVETSSKLSNCSFSTSYPHLQNYHPEPICKKDLLMLKFSRNIADRGN